MATRGRKQLLGRRPRKGKASAKRRANDPNIRGWRHVAEQLELHIASGRFAESGHLPPEAALADELGTSRHTLRLAIRDLIRLGVLRSVPYRGTFVAPRQIEFKIGPSTRLLDAIEAAGLKPAAQILSRRQCVPPKDVAQRLGVAKRTEVLEIIVLVTANGMPLGRATAWMPADRFGRVGEIIEVTKSLRRALAQVGVIGYRRRLVRMTSRAADQCDRLHLQLGKGAIVIGFDGFCIDSSGEPTHAFDYCFDASRIAFVMEP